MTIYQPTIALGTFIDMYGDKYQDTYLDSENNIAMINSIDSVAQTVTNAISLWLGEYQFDTTLGINWSIILGNPLNKLQLNTNIQTAVLAVPYVTSIINITFLSQNSNRNVEVTVKYYNSDSTVSIANAII